MSNIVIQENGKVRKVEDVEFVEDIIKSRKDKGVWPTIDKLVKYWAKSTPDDVEAMKINVEQYRETLNDKKFGQTTGGSKMHRRFTMAFPRDLMFLIRTQYKAEDLAMDNKFFAEFGKRYPAFQIPDEL